jgi:hypothetical protein
MLMQKETKQKEYLELNLLAEQMMMIKKKKSKLSAKLSFFAVHDLIIMSCALSLYVFSYTWELIGMDVQVENLQSSIFMRFTKEERNE